MPEAEHFQIIELDVVGDPIIWFDYAGPITINAPGGRPLCRLRPGDDGRWTAEYDPANLDEAARTFLDAVIRIGAGMAPAALGTELEERKAGDVTVRCEECGVIETGAHEDDLSEIEEEHVLTAHHPGLSYERPKEAESRA